MPRRRKVRVASARPKATVPDGDEGRDLAQETKKEKLAVLVIDFENEVKDRIEREYSHAQRMADQVEKLLRTCLIRMPNDVRHLAESEILARLESCADSHIEEEKDEVEETLESYSHQLEKRLETASKSRAKKRGTKSKKEATTSSDEENSGTIKKMPRPTRRKGTLTASNSNLSTSVNVPPSAPRTTRRTRQGQQAAPVDPSLVTPFQGRVRDAAGWDTPMVTPKFDPRLPMTPLVRDPRPGERVLTLSMHGSPLANKQMKARKPELTLPFNKNKTLVVHPETDVEGLSSAINEIDPATLTAMQTMHKLMGTILAHSKK